MDTQQIYNELEGVHNNPDLPLKSCQGISQTKSPPLSLEGCRWYNASICIHYLFFPGQISTCPVKILIVSNSVV